jgi:hypothetical protein
MSRTQCGGGNNGRAFNGIASPAQASDDHGQVAAYAWHVLKQDMSWFDNGNSVDCGRPQIPLVGFAFPFSGKTERLAGESRRNDVSHSPIAFSDSGVKFSDVHIPHRESFEATVDLSLSKHFAAVVSNFHRSYRLPAEQNRAEESAACAAEQTQFSDSFISHSSPPLPPSPPSRAGRQTP